MKFCSHCGSPRVDRRVPQGDSLPRDVCGDCGVIFYENPKIVAACILEWRDRILLCRRSIEPRKGMWTVPGGFMENGESVIDAARREAREEGNAAAENLELFAVYNLIYNRQVYITYRGVLGGGACSAGHETTAVALRAKDEIPWDEIAFLAIRDALELYVNDCRRGSFSVHQGDIVRDAAGAFEIIRY